MKNIALVSAAGRGTRFVSKYDIPKQYISIGDKTILRLAIESLINTDDIDGVVVIIHQDDIEMYHKSIIGIDGILGYVFGGATRQESIKNGLDFIKQFNPENVLIHDANRPLVDKKLIRSIVKTLEMETCVIPAVQIADTLKKCNNDKILWTVDRTNLWRAQTPQGFKYSTIYSLHHKYIDKQFTDDASIAEYDGIEVKIIPGSDNNIKITTDKDYELAKKIIDSNAILKIKQDIRIGHGYDIHKMDSVGTADFISLGGIKIPFNRKIIAHSDGDCVIHAIIDAILGSAGLGDIGEYFSPKDTKWLNADSKLLAKETLKIIHQKGVDIKNIDVTIILENPNLKDYKQKIRLTVAEIFGLNEDLVNIKAKTNEGMDEVGKGNAIAVHTVVLCVINQIIEGKK